MSTPYPVVVVMRELRRRMGWREVARFTMDATTDPDSTIDESTVNIGQSADCTTPIGNIEDTE